jgi:hypothetical protein
MTASPTTTDAFRQRLLDEMVASPTVDCHSHTMLRRDYEQRLDRSLFTLTAYFRRDMAGLAGQPVADPYAGAASAAERWSRLRDALERARNVSYWRHNILTYQGLFDLAEDDVTDSNWAALDARIRERTAQPGWYDHVVRERCNLIT